MGVRGLTTFINNNQDIYMKKYYLHNTNLVIDGLSLCSQLYRSLNCFSAFGGDYDKYASFVKNFFKNLRKCNVVPYIVFDGSYEKKKLRTVFNRLRSKLKSTSRLDPVTQGYLQIFPFLLRDVFVEVLVDMNISYTVCEFEADDEIASLARHLNCPVLSYDSDFFIYNVLYIPFSTIELKSKPIDQNGTKIHAMECKIYKVEYLTNHFGGLKEDLLPLLAILLGNDYVEKRVFKKFFSQLKLLKSKKKKNDQQRSINTLFSWLQTETLDTAVSKIIGRLKKNQQEKVLYIIKKGIEGYNNKSCQSINYFDIKEDKPTEQNYILPQIQSLELTDSTNVESDNSDDEELSSNSSDGSLEDDEESSDNEVCNENELPEWFVKKIRENSIPPQYLNLYNHHLHFCNPQIEDFSKEDSFLRVLHILRYAFDLLTDFSYEHCVYVSRENRTNYKKIVIGKEFSIPRLHDISISQMDTEILKSCFDNFLKHKMFNLDLETIHTLPSNFQLIMIAILWWIGNCSVPIIHIHSVIISYIMLSVIDERTGNSRGHFLFNNKHKKKLEELRSRQLTKITIEDELYLNKNKVQYEDCVIAASVLLKHFEIDDSIRKRPKSFDTERIHSFAQFQCILQQFNCLNILCGLPFEKTVFSKSYNGTFIYNIALKLENQIDPEAFIDQYLKGATTVLMFYKSICYVLNNAIKQMNLSTVKWSKRKRARRKNDTDDVFNFSKLESELII